MLLCADVHLYDIGPKPLVICVDFADIVSSDENALRNRKRTFIPRLERSFHNWNLRFTTTKDARFTTRPFPVVK